MLNSKKVLLWHSSELNFGPTKTKPIADKPRILGNWFGAKKKGGAFIPALKRELHNEFDFVVLKTGPTPDISRHNREVEKFYENCDIFLHLSTSEGFSYSTLDGFAAGQLICGTNTGLLYDLEKDGINDVAMIFDWEKWNDTKFVAEKIRELWRNRYQYEGKSQEWFRANVPFDKWKR